MPAGPFCSLSGRERSGDRVHALGQARIFAGHGVLMEHALGNAARHFGLRRLQRGGSAVLVTGGDGVFDLLHQRANARNAILVHDGARGIAADRSEEHTSELQSLMRNSYAVFCLKKKTTLYVRTTFTLSH